MQDSEKYEIIYITKFAYFIIWAYSAQPFNQASLHPFTFYECEK